jgi:hypothetical protein
MNPDIDAVNCLLEKYGRQLYRAGRPYGHDAETINAVSAILSKHNNETLPAKKKNSAEKNTRK